MFERTVCACQSCQRCCRVQPGHLLPGDMEKIADHLQQPLSEVKVMFWASPGAMAMDEKTGRQFRIGTITPRFDRRKKACVFLTEAGECRIHPVSPFGCGYFDTHQTAEVGQARSLWGMRQIVNNREYTALRNSLPFADSYRPSGYEEKKPWR